MKVLAVVGLAGLMHTSPALADPFDGEHVPATSTPSENSVDGGAATAESLYPAAAREQEIEGKATVECTFGTDGKPTKCDVISETPAGMGFGEATAKLFMKNARIKPSADGDGIVEPRRHKWTFVWVL